MGGLPVVTAVAMLGFGAGQVLEVVDLGGELVVVDHVPRVDAGRGQPVDQAADERVTLAVPTRSSNARTAVARDRCLSLAWGRAGAG